MTPEQRLICLYALALAIVFVACCIFLTVAERAQEMTG